MVEAIRGLANPTFVMARKPLRDTHVTKQHPSPHILQDISLLTELQKNKLRSKFTDV